MVSHHLRVYGTVPAKQCTVSGPLADSVEAVAANLSRAATVAGCPVVAVATYIFGIERPCVILGVKKKDEKGLFFKLAEFQVSPFKSEFGVPVGRRRTTETCLVRFIYGGSTWQFEAGRRGGFGANSKFPAPVDVR